MRFLQCLRQYNTKSLPVVPGFIVRGPTHTRVARERNRNAAILRHAKAIPPKRPVIHPITRQTIPSTETTCHSCGRQFLHRPRGRDFEPNPSRKYCHTTCQNSRPFEFDRGLEAKIMKVLKNTHHVRKKREKIRFRAISTDSIEGYVLRRRGGMFREDLPLHLRERIRQAARRLVGIPGRSGSEWQVIALEKVEGRWVRQIYAPGRGNIMLGLVKADPSRMDMKEISLSEAGLENSEETKTQVINGHVLKEPPEWESKYWWDAAGKVRPSSDTRRPQRGQSQPVPRDKILDGTWAQTQRLSLRRSKHKAKGWTELLRQNQRTIDHLTAQRNKDYGL
jgi:hypothetical protein